MNTFEEGKMYYHPEYLLGFTIHSIIVRIKRKTSRRIYYDYVTIDSGKLEYYTRHKEGKDDSSRIYKDFSGEYFKTDDGLLGRVFHAYNEVEDWMLTEEMAKWKRTRLM